MQPASAAVDRCGVPQTLVSPTMPRIVQVTDLHVAYERPTTALTPGKDTLDAVLDDCFAAGDASSSSSPAVDMLLLSGDNIHEEGLESYRQLRAQVEAKAGGCPVRALPGNHDTRRHVMQVFHEPFDPTMFDPAGVEALPATTEAQAADTEQAVRACFAEPVGGWLVVGLDTVDDGQMRSRRGDELVPTGAGNGGFDAAQACWLDTVLSAATSSVAVFLHHPPVSEISRVGGPEGSTAFGMTFERGGLTELEDVISAHSEKVKIICCGHFHAEFETAVGGVRCVGTPASYQTQFNLQSPNNTLCTEPLTVLPGVRDILSCPHSLPLTLLFE
jgi:3',5'-cyclic AMP phosphodiesterase CpdA